MQNRRPEHHSPRLELLAKQAIDFAKHMMNTTGSVPATVIADTDDGYFFCMPTSLTDEAAKDRFADVARLLAIATTASAIVMVVEAWVKRPDARGHHDTSTPPSQSPDRQEVVVLMLEDHAHSATSLLPILRNEKGLFTELADPGMINFGESAGRFSDLMPPKAPTSEQSNMAKSALHKLGMSVVNRGFNPSLN